LKVETPWHQADNDKDGAAHGGRHGRRTAILQKETKETERNDERWFREAGARGICLTHLAVTRSEGGKFEQRTRDAGGVASAAREPVEARRAAGGFSSRLAACAMAP
jgi:hypothetical protein